MATLTICDVKVCGKVINHSAEQAYADIAGKKYVFCIKCHADLMKFIEENLLSGQQAPVAITFPKLDSTDLDKITVPWHLIPSNPVQPVYPQWVNPTPYGFTYTLGNDTVGSTNITIAKLAEATAGYINAKT